MQRVELKRFDPDRKAREEQALLEHQTALVPFGEVREPKAAPRPLTPEERKGFLLLRNFEAQHPLCFPRGAEQRDYAERYEQITGIATRNTRGRVVRTSYGAYSVVAPSGLPNRFDYKLLMALMGFLRQQGGNGCSVGFPSWYAMMKALGLPLSGGKSYHRVLESLTIWSDLRLRFVRLSEDERGVPRVTWIGTGVVDDVDAPGHRSDPPPSDWHVLTVRLDPRFVALFGGESSARLNLKVVESLPSEAAVNLYSYLRSFDLPLSRGRRLRRKLREFCTTVLSSSDGRRPQHLRKQVTDAVEVLQEFEGYEASFERDLVVFRKRR